MRLLVIALLTLLALVFPTTAHADHNDDVHLTAHVGASFALDTFFYGFNKKALHMDNTSAKVFAGFTTVLVGALYKASENASGHDMIRATGQNPGKAAFR